MVEGDARRLARSHLPHQANETLVTSVFYNPRNLRIDRNVIRWEQDVPSLSKVVAALGRRKTARLQSESRTWVKRFVDAI